MTFKVTVVNKFSENVLHKGRNGAGVKAELFFIHFDKMFGKHHVSDTKRGRDRFGKGIQIYDISFLERCLPLRARDVALGSDVHCVSDVTPNGVVGKHHITLRRRSKTSL